MPNQRAEGQRLLTIPVWDGFVKIVDRGVEKSGAGDRSKFVRAAITERLQSMGIDVPPDLVNPPPRAGKTKPPAPFRYPAHKPSAHALNDAPISEKAPAAHRTRRPPENK